MDKLILFHGTPEKIVVPTYGKGEERHDYGQGFYLTEEIDLAKEWAVCRPNGENGWVHRYQLDSSELKILDFQEKGVLAWLAELMKKMKSDRPPNLRRVRPQFPNRSLCVPVRVNIKTSRSSSTR